MKFSVSQLLNLGTAPRPTPSPSDGSSASASKASTKSLIATSKDGCSTSTVSDPETTVTNHEKRSALCLLRSKLKAIPSTTTRAVKRTSAKVSCIFHKPNPKSASPKRPGYCAFLHCAGATSPASTHATDEDMVADGADLDDALLFDSDTSSQAAMEGFHHEIEDSSSDDNASLFGFDILKCTYPGAGLVTCGHLPAHDPSYTPSPYPYTGTSMEVCEWASSSDISANMSIIRSVDAEAQGVHLSNDGLRRASCLNRADVHLYHVPGHYNIRFPEGAIGRMRISYSYPRGAKGLKKPNDMDFPAWHRGPDGYMVPTPRIPGGVFLQAPSRLREVETVDYTECREDEVQAIMRPLTLKLTSRSLGHTKHMVTRQFSALSLRSPGHVAGTSSSIPSSSDQKPVMEQVTHQTELRPFKLKHTMSFLHQRHMANMLSYRVAQEGGEEDNGNSQSSAQKSTDNTVSCGGRVKAQLHRYGFNVDADEEDHGHDTSEADEGRQSPDFDDTGSVESLRALSQEVLGKASTYPRLYAQTQNFDDDDDMSESDCSDDGYEAIAKEQARLREAQRVAARLAQKERVRALLADKPIRWDVDGNEDAAAFIRKAFMDGCSAAHTRSASGDSVDSFQVGAFDGDSGSECDAKDFTANVQEIEHDLEDVREATSFLEEDSIIYHEEDQRNASFAEEDSVVHHEDQLGVPTFLEANCIQLRASSPKQLANVLTAIDNDFDHDVHEITLPCSRPALPVGVNYAKKCTSTFSQGPQLIIPERYTLFPAIGGLKGKCEGFL